MTTIMTMMMMTMMIRYCTHPLASARRKSWWISKHRPRYQSLHRYHHHRQPIHRCSPERRPPCNPDLTVALNPPLPFQRAVCSLPALLSTSLQPSTSYHPCRDYDLHFEHPATPNAPHPYEMYISFTSWTSFYIPIAQCPSPLVFRVVILRFLYDSDCS